MKDLNILFSRLQNNLNNKFFRDSLFTLFTQGVVASAGIFINILIGKFFSSEGLGVFSQALSAFMILYIIADLGFSSSVLKHSSQYKDEKALKKEILGTACVFMFLWGLILVIVLLITYNFSPGFLFSREASRVFVILSLSLPFALVNRSVLAYFNALRKMIFYNVIILLKWIINIGVLYLFIFIGCDLHLSIFSFIISEFLAFLTIIFYNNVFFKSFSYKWLKLHLTFGTKVSLLSFIQETSNRIDIFIFSIFLSEHLLGIYSFAASFAKGLLIVPAVVAINFNPIISQLWTKNEKQTLISYINKIKKNITMFVIPINILVCFMYPLIIKFFGLDLTFKDSFFLFVIMVVGITFSSIFYPFGAFLTMAGFPTDQLKSVIVIFLLNLFFNVLLIYLFGLYGAAIATSLFYILTIIVLHFFIKSKTGIKII